MSFGDVCHERTWFGIPLLSATGETVHLSTPHFQHDLADRKTCVPLLAGWLAACFQYTVAPEGRALGIAAAATQLIAWPSVGKTDIPHL